MIDKIFAEKFIEKILFSTEYNVNIMNEKGIIIASKDKSRVGEFHSIAYEMIQNNRDVGIAEKNDIPGSHPGVNMLLRYQGKQIGVIGMTGEPREVEPILKVMKISMETSLEYERYKEQIQLHRNMKEQFLNWILYGEDTGKQEIYELARQLGYRSDVIRIPILIVCKQTTDMHKLLGEIKKSEFHTKEDISTITRENHIIIYKYFRADKILKGTYKYAIGEYLGYFLGFLLDSELECTFYVGTFQDSLPEYRKAYRQCLWMKENIEPESRGVYFYDYVEKYLESLIPYQELWSIYHVFAKLLDSRTQREYIEVIEKLQENNYNLSESSKKLYIHKNTLIFRLNKIRECFDMNPLQQQRDRVFLQHLCRYLKVKK